MAIADLLKLADDSLQTAFNTKPFDPTKARKTTLEGIARTVDQFKSATPVKGRKWFKTNNGVVALTLPFMIGDKSSFFIPSERFNDFMTALKKSVTAGELDEAIKLGVTKSDQVETIQSKRSGGAGKPRAGWSPERRAQQAATIAARNAAKAA